MKNVRQLLEEFWNLAVGRCTLDLKNGTHLEGYFVEVKDSDIVFASGGPLASDEDELIPITDIDLGTLYFWSESERCYLHAKWNEEQNEWMFEPS